MNSNPNRRNFLTSLLAAAALPFAFTNHVAASAPILYGDGIHDDTKAMQAWINGRPVFHPNGEPVGNAIVGGTYFITAPLLSLHEEHAPPQSVSMRNATIRGRL